ncbi:MAG: sensor histidine kinase [Brumimicrobium sp.]|nr:sensor histidine kinase [Brumimicrobium sp.]MCO5267750.1 sensor histidine kinase [Brumimicrobium sp.]
MRIEEIIQKRLREYVYYICIVSAPLWGLATIFDYFYAPYIFYQFLPTRLIGMLVSFLLLYLIKRTNTSETIIISCIYLSFIGAGTYMMIYTDKEHVGLYFNNMIIMMLGISYILNYRVQEIIIFSIINLICFPLILLFGIAGVSFILANGGILYIALVIVMIILGILRMKRAMYSATMVLDIQKAEQVMQVNLQLEESLKEKETLLKEIHHRVKNNMQIISSILRIQNSYIKDETIKGALSDSVSRINSMSAIHEKLYTSKNFASIDFKSYLSELISNIIQTYKSDPNLHIEINTEIDSFCLNINQAIPCGLLVNEIFTNAVKYAFKNRTEGKICVRVEEKDKLVHLTIKDNGIGFTPNFNNSETVGLQLIESLVEQLEGSMDVVSQNGVSYLIRFPLENIMD